MSGFGIGVWGWDRGFGIEEGGEEEGEWTGRGRRRGGRGRGIEGKGGKEKGTEPPTLKFNPGLEPGRVCFI